MLRDRGLTQVAPDSEQAWPTEGLTWVLVPDVEEAGALARLAAEADEQGAVLRHRLQHARGGHLAAPQRSSFVKLLQ